LSTQHVDGYLFISGEYADDKGQVTQVPFMRSLHLNQEGAPAGKWTGYRITVRNRRGPKIAIPDKRTVGMALRKVRIGVSDTNYGHIVTTAHRVVAR